MHRTKYNDMHNQIRYTASGINVTKRVRILEMRSRHPDAASVASDKLVLLRTMSDEEPVMSFFSNTKTDFTDAVRKELLQLSSEGRPCITVGHHNLGTMGQNQMTRPFMKVVMYENNSVTPVHYDMHIAGHVHGLRRHRYTNGLLEVTATTLQVCCFSIYFGN